MAKGGRVWFASVAESRAVNVNANPNANAILFAARAISAYISAIDFGPDSVFDVIERERTA